jgi:hypothetical protein
VASLKLVDEATRWPDSPTTDCVMQLWMAAHRLPTLLTVDTKRLPKGRRPGWLRGRDQDQIDRRVAA